MNETNSDKRCMIIYGKVTLLQDQPPQSQLRCPQLRFGEELWAGMALPGMAEVLTKPRAVGLLEQPCLREELGSEMPTLPLHQPSETQLLPPTDESTQRQRAGGSSGDIPWRCQPVGPTAGPRRETDQHKYFLPNWKNSPYLDRAL